MSPLRDKIENWTPVEIIPAAEGQYCLDCKNVTRSPNGHCLACGSHVTMKLSELLEGFAASPQPSRPER